MKIKFTKPIILIFILSVLPSCIAQPNFLTQVSANKVENKLEVTNNNIENNTHISSEIKSVSSANPEESNKVTFKIKLDKQLFQKQSKVTFTLYPDKITSYGTCGWNPDIDPEPKPCAEAAMPPEPEKFILDINDSNNEVFIVSDKVKVGGTYRIIIDGMSNDQCRTISGDVSGEINSKLIEPDNIKFDYYGGKCLSGEIKDETGKRINNEVNLYIEYQHVKSVDGKYFVNNLQEGKVNIIAGAGGYFPEKENISINEISEKHDIILKRNLQNPEGVTLKFDKINSGFGYNYNKRYKIKISFEVNGHKHDLMLDPSTENNIEEINFNDAVIGDSYNFNISAVSEKSYCNDIEYYGEGIILNNGMFPVKEVLYTMSATSDWYCPNIETISGIITDKQGNLLNDVKVVLKSAQKVDAEYFVPWEDVTISNDQGNYGLKNIAPGLVTMTVSKEGYKTVKRTEFLKSESLYDEFYESNIKTIDFTGNYAMEKL
jgi:hypothetical protein